MDSISSNNDVTGVGRTILAMNNDSSVFMVNLGNTFRNVDLGLVWYTVGEDLQQVTTLQERRWVSSPTAVSDFVLNLWNATYRA